MSEPTESTYRLLFWETSGSSAEPTDSGRTGGLADLMEMGAEITSGRGSFELPDGRKLHPDDMAGFVVKPETPA